MRIHWQTLLSLAFLALACDRRVDSWADAEQEPGRPAQPVRVPGLEKPAMRGLPQGLPVEASVDASDRVAVIRGTVRLVDGVQADSADTLFLIARGPGSGPPMAVKKLVAESFPIEFQIGPDDRMIPGTAFEGPIFLGARLDADGDASTGSPKDASAVASSTLEAGATGAGPGLRAE